MNARVRPTLLGLVLVVCTMALAQGSTDPEPVSDEPTPPAEPQAPTGPLATPPVLDAVTGATSRYLPVPFASHNAHAGRVDCVHCHHDAEAAPTTGCSTCHGLAGFQIDLKTALHASCLQCHRDQDAASGAPVHCLGCHQERP